MRPLPSEPVAFVDLGTQYRALKERIDREVIETLESTAFVLGPKVEAFEARFAEYCGATHALGVNSGTSALHLALLAAGVGPGDEVITSTTEGGMRMPSTPPAASVPVASEPE